MKTINKTPKRRNRRSKTPITGIKPQLRFTILARDGFRCVYCGATSQDASLEVDHMNPASNGGSNLPSNLVTACASCNAGKGRLILKKEIWPELFYRIFDNHPNGDFEGV